MDDGLASQMVYGDGSSNTTKHYYAGAGKSVKNKQKSKKKGKKTLKSSFVSTK